MWYIKADSQSLEKETLKITFTHSLPSRRVLLHQCAWKNPCWCHNTLLSVLKGRSVIFQKYLSIFYIKTTFGQLWYIFLCQFNKETQRYSPKTKYILTDIYMHFSKKTVPPSQKCPDVCMKACTNVAYMATNQSHYVASATFQGIWDYTNCDSCQSHSDYLAQFWNFVQHLMCMSHIAYLTLLVEPLPTFSPQSLL